MFSLLLCAAALAGDVLGPLPEGTTLLGTEDHPEFVRHHLRVSDGGPGGASVDFVIELTRSPSADEPAGEPVCSGGGADLWVRLDLGEGAESFDWDPLPPIVDQACARLAEGAPALRERPAVTGPRPNPATQENTLTLPLPQPHIWPTRPLHAVVLAWLALLILSAPRGWRPWALGAAALIGRLLLSPRRLLLGGDVAYARLLNGQGMEGFNLYYGDTWWSFMGLIWRAAGEPADHVTAVNLGLSALSVPLLYGCVQALTEDRRAATAAAVFLALMPLPVAVSGSEIHFVLAGTLGVAGLYGAARGDRRGALLAALSAGLLAHLRPLQMVFALLPLALLVRPRRWVALVLGAGLLGWRGIEILENIARSGSPPVLSQSHLGVLNLLPGRGSALVIWDPWVSPAALTLLAIYALWRARQGATPRAAMVLLTALLATTLPYLPLTHSSIFDAMRFQLPAQTWLAALAGLAAPAVLSSGVWQRGAIALALALSWGLAHSPLGPTWAWTEEYGFLSRELHRVPEGVTVRYDDSQDPNYVFHTWLNDHSQGIWLPLVGERAQPGEWRYVGTADRLAGRDGDPSCSRRVVTQQVAPSSDGWVDFGPAPVLLGLFVTEGCPE